MGGAAVHDVDALIDGQKVRASTILFLVVATLAMVGDGFDLSAIGFVGPELVKAWHIAPKALAPALTAGLLGLLCGAPLFGMLGDRFGRKKAILTALCVYGVFTLATMAVGNLDQLMVLRFLTGIGLGGMIPNVLALTAEVAPGRLRGRFTIIVLFGVPAGISLPGWVAALLVPHYGWQVLLLVGGVLPLAIAALSARFLHESLKWVVQHKGRDENARELARWLRPDMAFAPGTTFALEQVVAATARPSPASLFRGGFSLITPALWIALAANQFTNFFAISWLPTLLQSAGLSTAQAGISASMFSTGGLVGGLVLIFLIDRLGVIPIIGLFLLGAPLVASMGTAGLSPVVLGAIIAGAGFCVTGNNFGINAAMVMIYPTPIRSTGAGWAQAMGRVGSLGAPAIGGVLLGLHLPMRELYLAPAAALLVGAAAAILLAMFCSRRFRGFRLADRAAGLTVSTR